MLSGCFQAAAVCCDWKNCKSLLKDSYSQKKKNPKTKKDFISNIFKGKTAKSQAQMYYPYISLCAYTLTGVFDSDFILVFLC